MMMKMRTSVGAVVSIGMAVMVTACSMTTVERTELAEVVARDGVPFALTDVPPAVLHRLGAHRLVIVGETHLIREHHAFMAKLVERLHERGFRQLLLEWPHMADWLIDEFTSGGTAHGDWTPPSWFFHDLLLAVRDFNGTLAPEERVRVRGIDVNLDEYGGAADFRGSLSALSQQLPRPGPVESFLAGAYSTPDAQRTSLGTLQQRLDDEESALRASWGDAWYQRVTEMVEVEAVSVDIREERDDDYDGSARRREDEMKRLTDLRLRGYPHRTILNVGGNHAQKEHLKGTEQEWLGDYLVHESTAVGGETIVLCVTAAEIVGGASWSVPDWRVRDASPDDEVWRVMNETWPDQTVFLPLDDAVFSGGVRMNFEGTIHSGIPKRHYDAFLQYPLAHRIRIR
jgi:hypothetical protein